MLAFHTVISVTVYKSHEGTVLYCPVTVSYRGDNVNYRTDVQRLLAFQSA